MNWPSTAGTDNIAVGTHSFLNNELSVSLKRPGVDWEEFSTSEIKKKKENRWLS